jgi:diguanylate cyclase (GGDEF)-like protein
MKLKKPIIFLLIFVSNIITYQNKFDSLMKDFKNTAISKEAVLNHHIDLISGYADLISVFGNSFLLGAGVRNSDTYNRLEYNSKLDYFHMDSIEGTELAVTEGNLTGIGTIPKGGTIREEVNLALHFNKIFHKLYHKLPDILCLKYISDKDFVNRYPFVPSSEFKFTKNLKKEFFFKTASPEIDTGRLPVWSPVYLNQEKQELIVTYSVPIYNIDKFIGVVAIDFTNFNFSRMIDSKYESYLVDNNNMVIAAGYGSELNNQVISLGKLLTINDFTVSSMKRIARNEVKQIGSYYVYAVRFSNAPWRLFFRVPAGIIIFQSLITTLPIMLICLFLLLALKEVEKRRNAERLLKSSINELKSYQTLLESAAKMDFLTTTYNRRGLKEKLKEHVSLRKGNGKLLALLIADIDYFKQYNDTYGHSAGDEVLIKTADIMKKNVNKNGIVCRWGGEEFLILLLYKTYEEALNTAEQIRQDIEAADIKLDNSASFHITITIGVAEYKEEETFEECVSKADKALYEGKELGRNRVVGSR